MGIDFFFPFLSPSSHAEDDKEHIQASCKQMAFAMVFQKWLRIAYIFILFQVSSFLYICIALVSRVPTSLLHPMHVETKIFYPLVSYIALMLRHWLRLFASHITASGSSLKLLAIMQTWGCSRWCPSNWSLITHVGDLDLASRFSPMETADI